jgi:hypothetical protein
MSTIVRCVCSSMQRGSRPGTRLWTSKPTHRRPERRVAICEMR